MIDIVNVHKSFAGREVLKGASFTIEDGETMVILGRSGGGKSVLLKHIMGLLRADRGQVRVGGKDIARLKGQELDTLRLQLGMLFQGAALFDSLNVGENVSFALREHTDWSEKEIHKRVSECLELVGLEGIEQMKPAELSGGMRKRVGLARALAMQPSILLYDEPTTGLDPIMADAINNLIIELHDRLKVTGVVVTHDMTSAYKVGERMAMLHEGQIIQVGTTDEIRNTDNPIVKQFILGQADQGRTKQ